MKRVPFLLQLAAAFLPAAPALAQANQDPTIDVKLAELRDITALGRQGAFPNGTNGVALTTTACNEGSSEVSWQQAMDPDHPFIAFLVARESGERFEQISDRSYVKHGFFALSNSFCSSCSPTDGTKLGIGCSDTYSVGNNGENFWLGPPEEIDPWLGFWDPVCSHFDMGEPPLPPPLDCNGQRSFTQSQADALGPVGHRIHLKDSDLNVAGASFYYQGQYVIETESERVRGDNLGSRPFSATWTGSHWNLNSTGVLQAGSILTRWSGASLSSVANGANDGRIYVAVKVTGPFGGFYHYNYALHNRDNQRGVGALHIPLCSGARVRNLASGDIDDDATNDWTASVGATEIVFSTGANPLRWNTIYDFSFESDAAPLASSLALDQFDAGPGLASLPVTSSAPTALFNFFLAAGCALDTPPTLYATGNPARAQLGNASFGLGSSGNDPFELHFLRASTHPGSSPIQGCTLWLGPTLASSFRVSLVSSDAQGVATHPAPVPNDLALEGLELRLQAIGRDPGNGALFGNFELSDALLVRFGNSIVSCP